MIWIVDICNFHLLIAAKGGFCPCYYLEIGSWFQRDLIWNDLLWQYYWHLRQSWVLVRTAVTMCSQHSTLLQWYHQTFFLECWSRTWSAELMQLVHFPTESPLVHYLSSILILLWEYNLLGIYKSLSSTYTSFLGEFWFLLVNWFWIITNTT